MAVTGDFVTYKGEEFIPFEQLFSNIKSKYGIYTVLDNHDYCSYYKWENRDDATRSLADLTNSIEKIGWQMLSNDSREITIAGDTINIIGVEHLGGADTRGNIREAIKGCDSSHYNILLSHTPESWASDISANYSIDLTLSGHTHAMQLKLKIFGK